MATIPEMCSAAELFRAYAGDLLRAIPEPDVIAWDLLSKRIISEETRQKASLPAHTKTEKNAIILAAVEGAITQGILGEFLTVLDNHSPADIIASKIRSYLSETIIKINVRELYNYI